MLLQVAAGFGGGFSVIMLWGHDTMMLLVSAIYVSCFYYLWFVSYGPITSKCYGAIVS